MVPPVSLTGEDNRLDGLAKASLVLPSSSLWTEIPARPSRTSPRSLPPDLSALSIFSKKVRRLLAEPVIESKVHSTPSPWFQGLTVSC